MEVGRKIYYDKLTGNVILDTGERAGDVLETTVEQDFQVYKVLSERNPETVGVIQIPYGQDREKFGVYPFHIDIVTEQIIWDLTPIQQEELDAEQLTQQRISDLELSLADQMAINAELQARTQDLELAIAEFIANQTNI